MKVVNQIFRLCLLVCLFISCGDDGQDARENAIVSANIALSSRDCNKAIEALERAPFEWKDATFIRTLSLSYACRGSFDVVNLFSNDLPLFGTVAGSILGGLALYSTSPDMESPTDIEYKSLETGLNYLLYAGGISFDEDPTPQKRESILGIVETQEIEMLAFYEIMVNLGRFLNYYGNTDSNGFKGGGSQSNKCFIVYQDLPLDNGLTSLEDWFGLNLTGDCNQLRYDKSGHQYLSPVAGLDVEKLCEGAVLVNNFLEIFPRVLASIEGADFDAIANIEATIDAQLLILEQAKSGTMENVGNVLSHSLCVSNNSQNTEYLQFYYAVLMEVLLK